MNIYEMANPIIRKIKALRGAWLGQVPHPERWVFLVGCYNSGTSLLHQILASHPQVGTLPSEGQFLTDQLLVPRDEGLSRLWALQPDRFHMDETSGAGVDVERLKRQWGAFFNDRSRPVLLEKSPTNAARTRWLQAHFENAHFVGIVRNGYAVAEGIRRRVGHPVELGAEQWARSNEIMLRDFEMIERKRIVRYEDLTSSPEEVATDILHFLELSAEVLSIEGRLWSIHDRKSEIKNMNAQSLANLAAEDRERIERAAGYMLAQLDYSWSSEGQ